MDVNHLKEVLKDKSFTTSLLQLETAKQVQDTLKEKSIDITIDEIKQIQDLIIRYQQGQLSNEEKKIFDLVSKSDDNELNEEDLEAVTGGFGFIFLGAVFVVGIAAVITDSIMDYKERRW